MEAGTDEAEREAIDAFRALRTPVGQELLTWLDDQHGRDSDDPLRRAARARRAVETWATPLPVPVTDLVGAALTQDELRRRGERKWGPLARRLYFTPNGLEQATRGSVARYRARRVAALLGDPSRPVADLACGIGADLLALASAGVTVRGVDRDALTVEVARANVDALELDARGAVELGDVTALARRPEELAERYAAVFCDPARRAARGRVFDPRSYSPPWDTVLTLAHAAPGACVKVAPGIAHDLVPPGTGAEWISVDGDLKEAALWFGSLSDGTRRATLLSERGSADALDLSAPLSHAEPDADSAPVTLTADPTLGDPPVAEVKGFLYEPDDAVIRAGLVAEAAAVVDGALLDPRIAYITGDALVDTPLCRAFAVTAVMPFSVKRLRAALRERHAGTVTIKKRGFAADVDKLRASLRVDGPNSVVVVLTRVGDRPISILCDEVTTV
ncbi:class I SAM-dependent methyltransferase [Spiractinospora alimapuensis]|uniref:class I SAM-dependent methyltransferase n=1 Tax=Spiractinospora alimapuensis TaxID=2820884 RepID=UPI001F169F28|nr:class I SAM-dependent methyltransferase [Spiractinospora alimapuensis]